VGKRPRPRQRWYDTVKKDLKKIIPFLDVEAALDIGEMDERVGSGDGSKWTVIALEEEEESHEQIQHFYKIFVFHAADLQFHVKSKVKFF